jgi:hypothetical protein
MMGCASAALEPASSAALATAAINFMGDSNQVKMEPGPPGPPPTAARSAGGRLDQNLAARATG